MYSDSAINKERLSGPWWTQHLMQHQDGDNNTVSTLVRCFLIWGSTWLNRVLFICKSRPMQCLCNPYQKLDKFICMHYSLAPSCITGSSACIRSSLYDRVMPTLRSNELIVADVTSLLAAALLMVTLPLALVEPVDIRLEALLLFLVQSENHAIGKFLHFVLWNAIPLLTRCLQLE